MSLLTKRYLSSSDSAVGVRLQKKGGEPVILNISVIVFDSMQTL